MSEENEYKCIVSGDDEDDESTIMLRSEGLKKVTSSTCGSETICVKISVFKNIDPVTLAADSVDETPDIVSKVVHIYWDDAKNQAAIDNGTLSTIIHIDEEKDKVAKEKLEAKITTSSSNDENRSRRKRAAALGNTGDSNSPWVGRKVSLFKII